MESDKLQLASEQFDLQQVLEQSLEIASSAAHKVIESLAISNCKEKFRAGS